MKVVSHTFLRLTNAQSNQIADSSETELLTRGFNASFHSNHRLAIRKSNKSTLWKIPPLFFATLFLQAFVANSAVSGAENLKPPSAGMQSNIAIDLTQQKDSAIRLQAKQAPLAQILQELADKTGVLIKYSVLPEAPVTATCVGKNVREVMECLVAKQINLVTSTPEKGKPAEFWLLGSTIGSCQEKTVATGQPQNAQASTESAEQQEMPQPTHEQSDALLKQLQKTKDAGRRTEIITNLASGGRIDDPNVRAALEDAMSDKDPGVRAQAVSTLAALDKDHAVDYLGQALKDKDTSVRLNAVDKADGKTEILEQALGDGEASVRSYAAAKLAELKQQQKFSARP